MAHCIPISRNYIRQRGQGCGSLSAGVVVNRGEELQIGDRNSGKCVDFRSVEKGVVRFREQPSTSVGELSAIPPGA